MQFWTYTCINWRRTLPYIRAWDAKYREQGLVVIGVHTPEFDFEENVENVRSALREMHIGYPIAIDNQHAIWNAFHNVYWPALMSSTPRDISAIGNSVKGSTHARSVRSRSCWPSLTDIPRTILPW